MHPASISNRPALIDYGRIDRALAHYQAAGYTLIDVPWIVSEAANRMTAPRGVRLFETFAGTLPASGEQSFLELMRFDRLDDFRPYVCVTPCFREEPEYNEWYQQGFLKVELIVRGQWDMTQQLLSDAQAFFQAEQLRAGQSKWRHEHQTPEGFDATLHGVEIGSYGHRTVDGYSWTYGTGLAEPRFSTALRKGA